MSQELIDLIERQRNLIVNTCNKIGCGNCGLEWEEDGQKKCSSTELAGRIDDLQMIEMEKIYHD